MKKLEYTQEEIDNEVEARVRFKMNELLTGISNRSKINWQSAFHSMNPKYHNYMEAFNEIKGMFQKELEMAYPYQFNEKQEIDKKEKLNKSIETISARLKLRGTRDGHDIEHFLYNELKKLMS